MPVRKKENLSHAAHLKTVMEPLSMAPLLVCKMRRSHSVFEDKSRQCAGPGEGKKLVFIAGENAGGRGRIFQLSKDDACSETSNGF